MNRIWDVTQQPSGVRGWLRKRALSLLMILVIGAVLVASLLLTAVLTGLRKSGVTLEGAEWLWAALEVGISLIVLTLLFAAIFHTLPDTHVGWRPTWLGGFVTAVLFLLGKWLVGLYLAHSTLSSAYGAAGSLVILLVWVYYCAIIFFFGAELTQVWARRHGWKLTPERPRGRAVPA